MGGELRSREFESRDLDWFEFGSAPRVQRVCMRRCGVGYGGCGGCVGRASDVCPALGVVFEGYGFWVCFECGGVGR
jgi:hypothetical protein